MAAKCQKHWGSLYDYRSLVPTSTHWSTHSRSPYAPALLLVMPAGAFLTLGFVIAAVQKIRNVGEDKARVEKLSKIEETAKKEETV